MKVAFNGTAMLPSLTGIGRYAREIALGLQRLPDVDAHFLYGVHWSQQVRMSAMPGASRLLPLLRNRLPGAYASRRWAQTASIALQQARQKFDIYHEPAIIALPFRGPTVLTVHDLSWIRFPETQPRARVRMLDRYFEPGLQRASMVLTPSEFVRQELIEWFALDPSRVVSTPLAAHGDFRPRSPQETRAVLERFGLRHGHYLLAVGTLEPRKNLSTALRAYLRLPGSLRDRFPLVVVGMHGWDASGLQEQLDPMVRSGQVKQLGYLPHHDLVNVTAGATALVFPSVYEGFGLPPLEAMACGVPPIVSNVASLPEVVGDAGLQVDPHDDAALASAMARLIDDAAEHRKLASLGIDRARSFGWDLCVQQTVAAYRSALGTA